MENYTKFVLKSKAELAPLLADNDKLFVIACNKCFKEYISIDEPEQAAFQQIADEQGKSIVGCTNVDFLCNKTLTAKTLKDMIPQEAENVFVISCGLGVQTIADLFNTKPVYAASDSVYYKGHHGMALTDARCDACGQCYLNATGGICPIIDCSKSLINGQCGGAKDGKCEIDKNKDCAWENIHQRLASQGRIPELVAQPTQVRDYSKINFDFVNQYVTAIREKRFEGYYGGIHPTENKEFTEHLALQKFPEPKTVVMQMSQHAGAPATPNVAVGDAVKVGQKIGDAAGFISGCIHASVSGTVVAVEPRKHPITGADVMSVVIESDGKNTLHESVKPNGDLDSLSKEDIIAIVGDKGIVGMGGAGFPTSVKINAPKPVDTVLLNGCECEPFLTADHRVLLEFADDVIFGLKALLKATGAEKGIIAIEDNKEDAIELLQAKTAGEPNMEIVVAKTKYPQGAEKMLIKRVLGRQVPSGGLPLDVGVVVNNISTAKAIANAIQTGMPLVERVVSVTGERMAKPGNYIIKIGTPVQEIIAHCGGVMGDDVTVKMGGPMMGFELRDLNVPIVKGTNGIIAIETVDAEQQPCIKCGRCVDVCPMELYPLYYPKYHETEDWEAMRAKNVMDCIECRCCQSICSSKIPIMTSISAGKKAIRGIK